MTATSCSPTGGGDAAPRCGARGIGAATGNRRNWKDGFYTREAMAERRRINGFIRECLRTLREFDGR